MTDANIQARRDDDLLGAVRRRDRQAFAELYRRFHPRLLGYLRNVLRDPQIAEEVLDDVMFVVWTDARRFKGQSAVSTWIFGIAYRRAMSALRVETRHQSYVDHSADTDRMPAERPGHGKLIKAALAGLSPDHRQVVELTYYFGCSYREIAAIAGCPENTVKTRMYHARRRLRHLLPTLSEIRNDQNRDHA
jgi:RNA polymerase sigma-70 factor (ECF subfamily)